ncbi:alpha/beta-hydrolase [Neolentinus lepideus HHB14362 ss-1]|uniref:Alpha/beta-hydrolase n=1 Tax=Neolentinus lepideus HHB14362 ss-1 TaxID=1314782 RepID=A0A165NIE7_9AGAM|nr:alpha/beta-hydrolase [Neolentinus lepideus HHB14362 ss-1]
MPSPSLGMGFTALISASVLLSAVSVTSALSFSNGGVAAQELKARAANESIKWGSCNNGFDNFQCANVTVPLDYNNVSDTRTMSIFVSRFPATNATRLGSVFLNPGGPGGSGSQLAFEAGQNLSTVLKGQYDIVGFDPRGVKLSEPYVSCFDNLYEEEKFSQLVRGFQLNLPANITSEVVGNLKEQITYVSSNISSLSAQCYQRVGDALRYMGTEMVVHDIDFMTKAFDGPDAPIHYWGWSYGTIIGQYMVQILPPERLGRIIIDGVVNPDDWAVRPLSPQQATAQIGHVFQAFADNCASAGDACAIGSKMTSNEIIAKINGTLDSLYASPVSVNVGYPATVDAGLLRGVLQGGMFSVRDWPTTASTLAQVFAGNYSTLVQTMLPAANPNDKTKPDDSAYAANVIACSDALQSGPSNPAPSLEQEVDDIVQALEQNSPQVGEIGYSVGLCHNWPSLYPNKSRYNGSFGLPDGTLRTPILIFTQANDPVTPYDSAIAAAQRLGNNSRFLEQPGGFGHTAMSQMSWCTLPIVQSYMLYGEYPESNHTICQVDQVPFVPWNASAATNTTQGLDLESRQAWADLNAALFP